MAPSWSAAVAVAPEFLEGTSRCQSGCEGGAFVRVLDCAPRFVHSLDNMKAVNTSSPSAPSDAATERPSAPRSPTDREWNEIATWFLADPAWGERHTQESMLAFLKESVVAVQMDVGGQVAGRLYTGDVFLLQPANLDAPPTVLRRADDGRLVQVTQAPWTA